MVDNCIDSVKKIDHRDSIANSRISSRKVRRPIRSMYRNVKKIICRLIPRLISSEAINIFLIRWSPISLRDRRVSTELHRWQKTSCNAMRCEKRGGAVRLGRVAFLGVGGIMWVYYYNLSGRLGTLGLILRRPDGSCHSFIHATLWHPAWSLRRGVNISFSAAQGIKNAWGLAIGGLR